jgi:hypothetical protein
MNLAEQKLENRLRMVEDHIGRSLAESEKSGELRTAANFGKPLDFGDGYFETPEELRMGFKILKDAGFAPPEIELMREIGVFRESLDAATSDKDRTTKRTRLTELQLKLAMQMERLRSARQLNQNLL